MVRDGDSLRPSSWEEALARSVDLLGTSGGVLASQSLSNEAFWVLERLAPRLTGALWPPAGQTWLVEGKIENLARCKTIVLVGLDAWEDLPVLALWIRKAVIGGAKLTVLGDRNGLWRNTTTWLKGDPLAHLSEVETSGVAQPAALLAHPSLIAAGRAKLEALAKALGATGETGLIGAPLLGANGRGALELAPDIASGDVDQVLTAKALLAIGTGPWAELNAGSFARVVLATDNEVTDDPRIDVVLPMAHAYERRASIVNLEGRVPPQEGGASPPPRARTHGGIPFELVARLGVDVPADQLETIRARIAAENPALADVVREEALVAFV